MLWWLSFSIMGIFHFQKFFTFPQVYVSSTQNSEKIIIVRLPTVVHIVKSIVFPVIVYGCESWTIKKAECWRMLLNCDVEVSWESLGLQGDHTSQSYRKSVLNIHWEDWCWSWSVNTLATWCEELTLEKTLMLGKDWTQEEKGMTEDEMVGWHHQLNEHEFEHSPADGERQGRLAYCSPWGHKE